MSLVNVWTNCSDKGNMPSYYLNCHHIRITSHKEQSAQWKLSWLIISSGKSPVLLMRIVTATSCTVDGTSTNQNTSFQKSREVRDSF